MVFRNFRLLVTGRILLLGLTLLLLFWLSLQTTYYATAAVVGLIIVYEIYSLIAFVERANRDMIRFLDSIRYADFTQSFSSRDRGQSFEDLSQSITKVMEDFRRVRTEKEEQYQYLQTLVQHVGVGLLVYRSDGQIQLINTAAKRLLAVQHLDTLEDLSLLSRELVETLRSLKPGEKTVFTLERQSEITQLAIYTTSFRIRDQYYTLASLQNIRSELEEKEMEAWQKLIRVLTHEIMNSITPISSLAATVDEMLARTDEAPSAPSGMLDDIRGAIQTIRRRSEGLLHFVDAYRNLTRLPRPRFKIFPIAELFAQVDQLITPQMRQDTTRFNVSVEPESLELTADPELVEQVLINLLLNALHAVQGQPDAAIRLDARLDERGRIIIEVTDNGPGISEEAREKIFVPFFTTKQDGSGIGLSLSKEIMRLHRGSIQFRSVPGNTVFRLTF